MDSKIQDYVERRGRLRRIFENERTGEQTLLQDRSKLFKPIIDSQKETTKALEDNKVSNENIITNQLLPIMNSLNTRIDQMESLQNLPYYNSPLENALLPIAQGTPIKDSEKEVKSSIITIDIDGELLNQTHKENLENMELDLPSIVQRNGNFEEIFKKIESQNRRLGQLNSDKTVKGQKATPREKEIGILEKDTLKKYTEKIKGLQGAKQFLKKSGEGMKLIKPKRGRGRPKSKPEQFSYKNPSELEQKLKELVDEIKNGNTTNDLLIKQIIEEMINIKYITEEGYKI